MGLPSPPTSSHSQVKVALAQLGAPLTCFLPSSSAGSSSYLFPTSTTALHSSAFADSLTTPNPFLVLSLASSFSCLSSTFHHHLRSPRATLILTGESPSSSCPSSPYEPQGPAFNLFALSSPFLPLPVFSWQHRQGKINAQSMSHISTSLEFQLTLVLAILKGSQHAKVRTLRTGFRPSR